jgi:murein DD-endopeptidase MepM/ murein hydrolase activator NlpD
MPLTDLGNAVINKAAQLPSTCPNGGQGQMKLPADQVEQVRSNINALADKYGCSADGLTAIIVNECSFDYREWGGSGGAYFGYFQWCSSNSGDCAGEWVRTGLARLGQSQQINSIATVNGAAQTAPGGPCDNYLSYNIAQCKGINTADIASIYLLILSPAYCNYGDTTPLPIAGQQSPNLYDSNGHITKVQIRAALEKGAQDFTKSTASLGTGSGVNNGAGTYSSGNSAGSNSIPVIYFNPTPVDPYYPTKVIWQGRSVNKIVMAAGGGNLTYPGAAPPSSPTAGQGNSTSLGNNIPAMPAGFVPTPATKGGFGDPLPQPYIVTSDFGVNRGNHIHAGVDLVPSSGNIFETSVLSATSGVVVNAGYDTGYTNPRGTTRCDAMYAGKGFGSLITVYTYNTAPGAPAYILYGHVLKWNVKAGDMVTKGQPIGLVGCEGDSTGAHLHFQVNDSNNTPINPHNYLSI